MIYSEDECSVNDAIKETFIIKINKKENYFDEYFEGLLKGFERYIGLCVVFPQLKIPEETQIHIQMRGEQLKKKILEE